MEVNGTHQLLAYANDVNLLAENKDSLKKPTEAVLDASEEVGLEANAEEAKRMFMSSHQNAGDKP